MSSTITTTSLLFLFMAIAGSGSSVEFIFDGEFAFRDYTGNVTLGGSAAVDIDRLLKLTDSRISLTYGHAFYSKPFKFKSLSAGNRTKSFSTTFVFAISPSSYSGHGLAFVISPSRVPSAAGITAQNLGLFNFTSMGNLSNHIVAVELDTFQNVEYEDINNNHVGIDINSLISSDASPAYYTTNRGVAKALILQSGEPMQVWVDYDGEKKQLNVSLAPANQLKPTKPLLSPVIDLSEFILEDMYVGFSASTGRLTATHYICGWSFKMEGEAPKLNLSNLSFLPSLPGAPSPGRKQPKMITDVLKIGLPIVLAIVVLSVFLGVGIKVRKSKSAELLEDWEKDYGPHRFAYKDLFIATKGFSEKEVLGTGGFGKVYKGVFPSSNIEIAVKRISHESRQGIREFVAEIVSLGHLRHRNLVQLLGYCRCRRELLIVYEFIPNGSLDKYLFHHSSSLSWKQRIRVVHGVASGLLYLHEDWEQVVLHRDIKASNVLLDGDYSAWLGDFGLARLYSHGSDPETTHVAGTFGYIAPEFARTGKATTGTDVFAFGVFVLEVVTGRRPVDSRATLPEEVVLVDWVLQCWRMGSILEARDSKLGGQYVGEEVEMMLKLGLLCSHPIAAARPTMRRVMQYLEGDASLPQISDFDLFSSTLTQGQHGCFYDVNSKDPYSQMRWSSLGDSLLHGGR